MFCEQPGGVESFFPRVCFYVNQALARPPPRLCAGIRIYLSSSSSSMYLPLCVCMYTVYVLCYVCILCMCVAHSVRARPLRLPYLRSVCIGVPVLVYCMHVVGVVVVMGVSLTHVCSMQRCVCIYCVSWMYVLQQMCVVVNDSAY